MVKAKEKFKAGDRVVFKLAKYCFPNIGTVVRRNPYVMDSGEGWNVKRDSDGRTFTVVDGEGVLRRATHDDESWFGPESVKRRRLSGSRSQRYGARKPNAGQFSREEPKLTAPAKETEDFDISKAAGDAAEGE